MTGERAHTWDLRDTIDTGTGALGIAVIVGAVQCTAWWVPTAIVIGLAAVIYTAVGLLRPGGPIRADDRDPRTSTDWWNGAGALLSLTGLGGLAGLPMLQGPTSVTALYVALLALLIGYALMIIP